MVEPVALDGNRLVASLESGRMDEAAAIIARDPVAAHKVMAADRLDRLETVERFRKSGNFVEAIESLEQALKSHPGDPSFESLLYLTEKQSGHMAEAAEALNNLGRRGSDPQPFLAEVNHRLKVADVASGDREGLLTEGRKCASFAIETKESYRRGYFC